jgi:beta-lactamase class D
MRETHWPVRSNGAEARAVGGACGAPRPPRCAYVVRLHAASAITSVADSRSPGFICTDSNTPSEEARRDVKSIVAVTRSINYCAGRLTIAAPFVRVSPHEPVSSRSADGDGAVFSLIGFDSGILVDADRPAWPYKQEYQAWNDAWKQTTTPQTWLRDSVVWYSQVLTRKLGAARLQGYIDKLAYANRDLSGEPGRNDGLTTAWLSSSLRISATEQVEFVRRMIRRQLRVSRAAIDRTMALMPAAVTGGWRVSGKTGTGFVRRADGTNDPDRQVGWFVGWATREGRTVVFARLLEDERPERVNAGLRARDALLGDWAALMTSP